MGLPRAGARKISSSASSFSFQLSSPAGGRWGGLWVHNVYTMGAPCALMSKFPLYHAKSPHFRALNRYTFTM
nr:MAG TPA: hypothetical protein [Caudoviricetes sp.]